MLESWRLVLRDGFLPGWSSDVLEKAIVLLEADSPKIVQGSTTTPPPLMCMQDWAVEACDIVAFCSTPDCLEATVGQAEEGFARACFETDSRLGEPAACRWFLRFFDDTPRAEVFRLLIEEFKLELSKRISLPADLKSAVDRDPNDTVLRRACFDWLLENGADAQHASQESGWANG